MSWFLLSLTIISAILKSSSMDHNINMLTPVLPTSEKSIHFKVRMKSYGKEELKQHPYLPEDESLLPSVNDFAKNVKEQELTLLTVETDSPPVLPQGEKVIVKKLDDVIPEIRTYHCEIEPQSLELEVRCYGTHFFQIPQNLTRDLEKLTIIDADIQCIKRDSLIRYRTALRDITLGNLPQLTVIERGTFADIPNLRTVYITQAPRLKFLYGLLDGVTSKKFNNLRILQTGLVDVSDLIYERNIMDVVDLDSNKIQKIQSNSIKIKAIQLSMNFNEITSIEDYAFNGSQIGKLHFNGNGKLKTLNPDAFAGMKTLIELDLSSTGIESLPITGLSELEVLKIQRTPSLKTIPSIYDLAKLQRAILTHPFHCCSFKYPEQHHPEKHAEYQKKAKLCHIDTGQITTTPRTPVGANNRKRRHSRKTRDQSSEENEGESSWSDPLSTVDGIGYENFPSLIQHIRNEDISNNSDWDNQDPLKGKTIGHQEAKYIDRSEEDQGFFHQYSAENKAIVALCGQISTKRPSVECHPEPNALNPCEDIMGSSWLRISVWFVVVLAVVGNLAVIIVVLFSGTEINVSRFLICNLAFADFCMGLYLLLIACMDLHSVGTYFNFAFDWQYGLGCQLAGFLTVFASHLSIFTLTVVTLERWFAITYAIHLTRRIRIGAAAKTMLGGWIYSVFIAALPVLGVSNYSSTSICLPMEVHTVVDKAYLYAIIIVNGLAFILIVFCYSQIYFSLGYETRRANTKGEMTIAKKMALLIFTDFATWAPIAFFGLTALAGYPLIGVPRSKILLVFFYPLNACANPYLYALMTAQYRKDFFQMISRIGLRKNVPKNYTVTTTLRTSNNSQPVPLLTKTNGNCHHVKTTDFDDTYV